MPHIRRCHTALAAYILIQVVRGAWIDTVTPFDGVLRKLPDGRMVAYMVPPYESNHASFIERLPNGDYVMAWFSGSKEGYSDVAIVVSHLYYTTRNATTWIKAQTVSKRKGYSNQNPVLFHDEVTNILYLFHTQQEAKKSRLPQENVGSEDSSEIWQLQSVDGTGQNWTTPKPMFQKKGSFDRNRVLLSLNKTWYYPIYYAGGSSSQQYSIIKECTTGNSDDKWLEHPFPGSSGLVQPSTVRQYPGLSKLVTFFRDRSAKNIYKSSSSDDGITWSKPSKTTLPNNNSGIEANVLKSGNMVIVYNPTNHARNPIVISLSTDHGESWKYTRVLEKSSATYRATSSVEYSYPTVLEDPITGQIHVSYTYNRDTIKHTIIPNEQWIINGSQ